MIVQHIAHISFEKIIVNRMVAYFKVDKKENVWFLWTSSIRVKEVKFIKAPYSFSRQAKCKEK